MIAGSIKTDAPFGASENMTDEKMINLTIRVEPKTKELLNLICAVNNISINKYINNMLKDKFKSIDGDLISQLENNLQDL